MWYARGWCMCQNTAVGKRRQNDVGRDKGVACRIHSSHHDIIRDEDARTCKQHTAPGKMNRSRQKGTIRLAFPKHEVFRLSYLPVTHWTLCRSSIFVFVLSAFRPAILFHAATQLIPFIASPPLKNT